MLKQQPMPFLRACALIVLCLGAVLSSATEEERPCPHLPALSKKTGRPKVVKPGKELAPLVVQWAREEIKQAKRDPSFPLSAPPVLLARLEKHLGHKSVDDSNLGRWLRAGLTPEEVKFRAERLRQQSNALGRPSSLDALRARVITKITEAINRHRLNPDSVLMSQVELVKIAHDDAEASGLSVPSASTISRWVSDSLSAEDLVYYRRHRAARYRPNQAATQSQQAKPQNTVRAEMSRGLTLREYRLRRQTVPTLPRLPSSPAVEWRGIQFPSVRTAALSEMLTRFLNWTANSDSVIEWHGELAFLLPEFRLLVAPRFFRDTRTQTAAELREAFLKRSQDTLLQRSDLQDYRLLTLSSHRDLYRLLNELDAETPDYGSFSRQYYGSTLSIAAARQRQLTAR